MEHLSQETKELLLLSNTNRIYSIQNSKWIGYSRAKEILGRMEDLLHHPPTHRMPNLLIVGDTNNGKTVLVNKFTSMHQPFLKEEDGELVIPILYVQSPPEPDERRFYNVILDKLFAPYKISDRVDKKQLQVIHLLKKVKLKVLIIDEIHHVLAGTVSKQRLFLNVIKYLSNELEIPIVCTGIKDAYNAIQSDSQLANRFEPAVLHRWTMNDEYMRLLASFEYLMPLKNPSFLTEDDIALKILGMSEGTIGEISTIIKLASIDAINNGTEQITKKTLSRIKYLSPSDRKKEFYKM